MFEKKTPFCYKIKVRQLFVSRYSHASVAIYWILLCKSSFISKLFVF